jgi:hypothetical protein
MIEGISAVTLGTHEMPRSVGFVTARRHVSKVPIGDLLTPSDTRTAEPRSLPHPQPRLIGPEWSKTWTTTNGERP